MKTHIMYFQLRFFPSVQGYPDTFARVVVVRRSADRRETREREYSFLTQSSFQRIIRAQNHFMAWNGFEHVLHRVTHT